MGEMTIRQPQVTEMGLSHEKSNVRCVGELIPVGALSKEKIRVLWCSGCDTEFTYTPDYEWVTIRG